MTQLNLTVTFKSDWAIGSGHAQHDGADSLIRRDPDGLPIVPGKTIRGILRDATELIALGLDDGASSGTWDAWTRYLWGSGQSDLHNGQAGVVEVPTAVVDDTARAVLLADDNLVAASVITRSSVAIDCKSGIARHDMLRTLERGRRSWVLTSALDVGMDLEMWQDADLWPARFLLAAAVRTVRRLGSDRRRGAGAVALTVPGLETDWSKLLDLASTTKPDHVPRVASAPRPSWTGKGGTSPWKGRGEEGWQRFLVTLRAKDPLLVRSRVLGNAALSQTFIPGGTLLPLIARSLGDGSSQAIASGRLIVTDATPSQYGADRSFAMPQCLHQPKVRAQDDDGAINVMLGDLKNADGTPRQTVGLQDYLGPSETPEASPESFRTHMVTTVHNSIEDDLQRPGLNGLYSYEAIAPGSELTFEVLVRDAARIDPTTLVPQHARVGASLSAEYGRVRLTSGTAPLKHAFAGSGGITAGTTFTIWLVSALIPDDGPDLAALLSTLGKEFGTTLELAPDIDAPSLMARFTRRDSWQKRWKLARPSLVAFEAGTVLRVISRGADISEQQISRVEAGGVGLRRAEGFGRVLVRPPLLDERQLKIPEHHVSALPPSVDGQLKVPTWLGPTIKSACLTAIEDECWLLAEENPLDPRLSRSQVGRLRAAAEQALASDSLTSLKTWATAVKASQQKDKWGGSETVDGLIDPGQVLETLGQKDPRLDGLVSRLPDSEEQEAVRRRATCMLVLARIQSYTVKQSGSSTEGD